MGFAPCPSRAKQAKQGDMRARAERILNTCGEGERSEPSEHSKKERIKGQAEVARYEATGAIKKGTSTWPELPVWIYQEASALTSL